MSEVEDRLARALELSGVSGLSVDEFVGVLERALRTSAQPSATVTAADSSSSVNTVVRESPTRSMSGTPLGPRGTRRSAPPGASPS